MDGLIFFPWELCFSSPGQGLGRLPRCRGRWLRRVGSWAGEVRWNHTGLEGSKPLGSALFPSPSPWSDLAEPEPSPAHIRVSKPKDTQPHPRALSNAPAADSWQERKLFHITGQHQWETLFILCPEFLLLWPPAPLSLPPGSPLLPSLWGLSLRHFLERQFNPFCRSGFSSLTSLSSSTSAQCPQNPPFKKKNFFLIIYLTDTWNI